MDANYDFVWRRKLEKLVGKIQLNMMDAYIADTKEQIHSLLDTFLTPGCTVFTGGSMTLKETGVLDYLENGNFAYSDRYAPDVQTPEAQGLIFRQAFSSDFYITSTNAITEEGWLYNVDGTGNRAAAMLYGPRNVIVICGRNKLVPDLDAAIERNKEISGPCNSVRLARKTPCTISGRCEDCKSLDRICNEYTLIKRNLPKGRIKVILLNFDAGY